MKIKNLRLYIIISIIIVTIIGVSVPTIIYFTNDSIYKNLTYAALGDSITYGYDSTNGGKQMRKPYPELVEKELRLREAYNYGISGSTLTSNEPNRNPMSIRYSTMKDNIDIVSVLGGINDYGAGIAPLGTINDYTTTTIYGSLNVLAQGLKEKYSNSYIFFMTPFKWGNDKGNNKQGYALSDLCNAIKKVCNNYEIDVLDLYTYGNIEIDYAKPESDQLHPSQEFFKKYTAPQIADFIRENYQ